MIDKLVHVLAQALIVCGMFAEGTTTFNQLLTEMDGFDKNTNVVVMAATNRPEALDPALTRPGRFDRILTMPLPNLKVSTACSHFSLYTSSLLQHMSFL